MPSQAMQMLYSEHEIIQRKSAALQQLLNESDLAGHWDTLRDYVKFFRTYADHFHHQKEEQVLFPLLKQNHPALGDIVDALEEHHEMFRDYLTNVETAIGEADWDTVRKIFTQYISDLTDHISAEDDELFVAVDGVLSDAEKERLYFNFVDKDMELGEEEKQQLEQSA